MFVQARNNEYKYKNEKCSQQTPTISNSNYIQYKQYSLITDVLSEIIVTNSCSVIKMN